MFLKRLASFFFLEEKPSIPQEYSHLHLHSKGFFPDFLFAVKLYTYASSAIVRETRKQDKLLVAIGTVSLFWILFFLQVTVLFRLVWLKCPCLLFSKLKAITHTFFFLSTHGFSQDLLLFFPQVLLNILLPVVTII